MVNHKLKSKEIIEYFKNKPFTSNDLYEFYKKLEPDLKKSAFKLRVHNLKKQGIINSLMKGVYITTSKKNFEPPISDQLINLFFNIKKKFPYAKIAIWETSWLNKYMVHQVFSNNIILEVEKDAARAVFSYLQEDYSNVYLNSKKFEIEHYIISKYNNIIIKNLTMTSPLMEKESIKIPTIEKIIVDLYMDKKIFNSYQGSELKNIFQEFFNTYNINQSTLRQYANKRHIKDKLIYFLENEVGISKEMLLI